MSELDKFKGAVSAIVENMPAVLEENARLKAENAQFHKAKKWLEDQLCEGFCLENGGKGHFTPDCTACEFHKRAALGEDR